MIGDFKNPETKNFSSENQSRKHKPMAQSADGFVKNTSKIPIQLKDCSFCKIKYKTKKPYENNWINKGYSYSEMSEWLNSINENYGVLAGLNELGMLDDDSKDKILMKLYQENFPETFRVRDHFYIKLKGWDGKKIIFYKESGEHLGELQGIGTQVVAPNSIHPSGEKYEVVNDIPIVEIDYLKFLEVFKPYFKKMKQKIVTEFKPSTWEGDDIKDIPITLVLSPMGMCDKGNSCYQGSHPIHGSTTGHNFVIDSMDNTWYCFRHWKGGGIWTAIAVAEGILDCSDCCRGYQLSESERTEVVKVAIDKYGLKPPEDKQEPMGWAKSINIKKLAERKHFTTCPTCKKDFEFNERLGLFSCDCVRGRIKQFMKLCLQQGNLQ